jgi:Undecaprenyl-phosphate glucose phosphotransferase
VSVNLHIESLAERSEIGAQPPARTAFPKLPFQWVGPVVFGVELLGVLAISVISGVLYCHVFLGERGDFGTFVAIGAVTFLYYAMVFAYRGNYRVFDLTSGWKQIREVTAVWTLVCLFLTGVAFLLKIGPHFSRGATSAFFLFGWLFLVSWRCFLAHYLMAACAAGGFAGRKVIVVGDAKLLNGSSWLDDLRRYGYWAVKFVPVGGIAELMPLDEVIEASRADHEIEGIFLLMDWAHSSRIERIVGQLNVIPLPIRLLLDNRVSRFLSKSTVRIGPSWAAELQRGPLTMGERVSKRLVDIVIASSMAIVLVPLLAVVSLLVKCDSRGPIFFTQRRGGFNGRLFRIFKFRTLTAQEDGNVVPQVCRDDHRLTRMGRLLRRTSIDELPQLLNVIRGEMSLIGPRPHAAAHNSHYERLIGNYAFRHHVKPGITGWAQVNGFRGETNIETMRQRVNFDLWYIDNWSLWLDLKILAKTLAVLFRQPMAY